MSAHTEKRVLVTGGSGFIGAAVVRYLITHGYTPYLLLRPTTDTSRLLELDNTYMVLIGDLLDSQAISRIVHELQPTHCIHLAWYAVPGKYHYATENLDFLKASIDLVQGLMEVNCQRFVGIGTCFEYDTDYGYLSESSPLKPRNLYAATKASLFQVLQQVPDFNSVWVRLFYQYGTHESPMRLMPAIMSKMLRGESVDTSEGHQVRDYLHVDDVASAIVAIMESPLSGAVNVGSGIPMRVTDIIALIEALTGKTGLVRRGALPHNPADPAFICANIERLTSQTTWRPTYSLKTGLEHTIEWWKTQIEIP